MCTLPGKRSSCYEMFVKIRRKRGYPDALATTKVPNMAVGWTSHWKK
jgi:hypothetical protein